MHFIHYQLPQLWNIHSYITFTFNVIVLALSTNIKPLLIKTSYLEVQGICVFIALWWCLLLKWELLIIPSEFIKPAQNPDWILSLLLIIESFQRVLCLCFFLRWCKIVYCCSLVWSQKGKYLYSNQGKSWLAVKASWF